MTFHSSENNNNYPEYIEQSFEFIIPSGMKHQRLDIFLTHSIANASRTKVQKAIDSGNVLINGKIARASQKVQPYDNILCKILKPPPIILKPENIPLEIVYEDEYLVVINKRAGMVCHPGFGNRYGTLVNAILYYFGMRDTIELEIDTDDELTDEGLIYSSNLIRPGLVHRLDKDTTGLVIITKNPEIHNQISSQFENRTIQRSYKALIWGKFDEKKGFITGDIGRSPKNRKLFTVVEKGGKHSKTEYEVINEYEYLSLVKLKLHTGRTHQIRVHLSHIKKPVFGDKSYGGDRILYGGNNHHWKSKVSKLLAMINHQLLHAYELSFFHPILKENIILQSEIPNYFREILNVLE